MNAFKKLLDLPESMKHERGLEHTPREIAQQPDVWRRIPDLLGGMSDRIGSFMEESGMTGKRRSTVILAGAGTSEFIGNAVSYGLRTLLDREVISVPTTHLVTHAGSTLVPSGSYVMVSFARSGDSPESVAAYRLVRKLRPDVMQLVITCNGDGALARAAASDSGATCIVLPPETNDRSLVMTSSFSTMALTAMGLGHHRNPEVFRSIVEMLSAGAARITGDYGDMLEKCAGLDFDRAEFLGSNTLYGTMQECHLKMQEITEGRVASRYDSFLGLRHGPQVFVNERCFVLASLSGDPGVRRYEMDMLRQLRAAGQGCGMAVVCARRDEAVDKLGADIIELWPGSEGAPDMYRVMTDVVAGQTLALFKCLAVGLKPDNPSVGGTINRVVKGVTIYDD